MLFYWSGLFLCLILITTCKELEKSMLVATDEATNVLTNSADLPGQIIDLGGGATQHGHYYGKTANPSTDHTTLGAPNSVTGFTSQLTNLEAGTKYFFKAYITDGQETKFGKEKSFTTVAASAPTLTTTAITSITLTGAVSGGNITSDGGAAVTARGVCWGSFTAPTTANNKTSDAAGTGTFTSTITGLSAGSAYFVRAYATNSAGTTYGNELTFTTTAASIPTVTTNTVSGINFNSGIGGGNVTSDGGSPVLEKGVCWSTATGPTINNTKTTNGPGTGSFGSSIEGLSPTTKYYVRAYATNIVGTAYGSEVSFTTSAAPVQLPVLTTVSPGNITSISATSGGDISSDGGASVTSRGVCWNTAGSPTTDGLKTTEGSGTGPFASTITGLTPNTKYYVRAYAINSTGTGYGNEYNFTTLSASSAVLTTSAITSIAQTTASGGGNITSDGGAAITARGVCWSLNQTPTLADAFTVNDFGTGIFNSQLTNLSPGRTYYVRAYATNSTGTTYGNQVSFLTASDIPKVTTSSVGTVTATTATVGGEVLDNNGSTTTTRGVCYNSIGSPTIADNIKSESGGIGTFTMSLTGLTPNTSYYVRAFATNGVGTAYGAQVQLVTPADIPTLTTNAITAVTTTTATSGGVITSDNGSTILVKGVCWSTNTGPVIGGANQTNDGGSITSYSSAITGLLPGTTYYVRAYATNGKGTAYGNELTFTTNSVSIVVPTLSTTGVSVITSTTAKSGGSITSNGGATVTATGVCWGLSANPVVTDSHTSDGAATGAFTSSISSLTSNTTYHLRAYATNSAGTGYGNDVTFTTSVQVTDADGNTYNTVKIGTQLWMIENLKTTKYRDGTNIPKITDQTTWANLLTGAYSEYSNDNGNVAVYGRLYNYYATINNLNLCPTGWHVPTDDEWTVLTNFLGGESVNAGGKLKESGTTHWTTPNFGATNESGFTALPGGARLEDGTFSSNGLYGYWWSTTEFSSTFGWNRLMDYSNERVYRDGNNMKYGMSVRCIQGQGQVLPAVTTTAVTGITTTGATSGGNVTSGGNASVTTRGVCWSTSTNPTVSLATKTTDASGTGSFTSTLSGLSPSTTYYVRAYATNSVGTAYGAEVSFTTLSSGPGVVNLGTSGSYVILAKAAISNVGTSNITGDLGLSPAASTLITGLALVNFGSYSTSLQVTGQIFAADMAPPTPTNLTTAVSDMVVAYMDAAGRTGPDYTDLGAGNIGGQTFSPGLYKWTVSVTVPTNITISGGSNDVWIFQISQDFSVSSGVSIILAGGAQAKNVFWQVGGHATFGTSSNIKGIILSNLSIIFNSGATFVGRAHSQTSVSLDANTVITP
jgi:uncharacterized protein (TIGR02145 family)